MLIVITFVHNLVLQLKWNQSTKKVIEPKKISQIVVRKKIRTKLGEKNKTEINREENEND